jgi:hypothetical protein
MSETTPGQLQKKGAAAEKLIHDLASKTFLTDWCYPNPLLPDGKELADLLVVFGKTAIIWQIKDLKLDEQGFYKKAEVEKNIRQLSGARRQLFDLKTKIELQNPRRDKEAFDAASIEEVFLISVLMGEGEEAYSGADEIKNHTVHVFDRESVRLALEELDTVWDFCAYLREEQKLMAAVKQMIVMGGEKELLATYLLHDRSFEHMTKADLVLVADDAWDTLRTKEEYQRKKRADKISYGWDSIIDTLHQSGSRQYELVARELAAYTRFQRRFLSQNFFDAHQKAHEDSLPIFRRFMVFEDRTFCFLFAEKDAPRSGRQNMLGHMCFVARGLHPQNQKVIGIATEKRFEQNCTYDVCLLEMPEWTDDNQREMEDIRAKTGIGVGTYKQTERVNEYPDK